MWLARVLATTQTKAARGSGAAALIAVAMKHLSVALWGLAIGLVVLDVFFSVLAGIAAVEVAGVTAVAVLICVLWLVRSVRIEFELRSRAGDPQLRASHNRARERRGF